MRWGWRRCAGSSRCLALAWLVQLALLDAAGALVQLVQLVRLLRLVQLVRLMPAGAPAVGTVRGVLARVTMADDPTVRNVDYETLLGLVCGGGVETVDVSGEAGFGDGLCSAVAGCVGRGLVRRVVDVSESSVTLAGLGVLAGALATNETCGVVCHGLVDCSELSDVALGMGQAGGCWCDIARGPRGGVWCWAVCG